MDCNNFIKWNTQDCCDSCHDDYEEYYIEACNLSIDDKDYHVCCKLHEWYLDEHPNHPEAIWRRQALEERREV